MSNEARIVMGVDGGGTQTTAIVARWSEGEELQCLARGQGGPANPHAVGWEATQSSLLRSVTEACRVGRVDRVDAACFSVAGCGRPEEQAALMQWLETERIAETHIVVDDGRAILRAGTPDGNGVAVIAGTGSLVVGRNVMGEAARAGGWGYLLGDEGSGYAIGLEGLKAVTKAADGVGPKTELSDALLSTCMFREPAELIQWVYGETCGRRDIGWLAPVVLAAAKRKDEVALSIVWRQLHMLERQVRAVISRLGYDDDEDFHIALAGGVMAGDELYRSRLLAELRIPEDRATVVQHPEIGAALLAAELS